MTASDPLLNIDPVALTMRQMLLRIDARLDAFDARIQRVEDAQLVAEVERRTVVTMLNGFRAILIVGAATAPVVAAAIALAFNSR